MSRLEHYHIVYGATPQTTNERLKHYHKKSSKKDGCNSKKSSSFITEYILKRESYDMLHPNFPALFRVSEILLFKALLAGNMDITLEDTVVNIKAVAIMPKSHLERKTAETRYP